MHELGKARVRTFVEYGNSSSLKAHLRFGFKPVKRVPAVRVLGRTMFRERLAAPLSIAEQPAS